MTAANGRLGAKRPKKKLELLEASDEAPRRKQIDKCIKQLQACLRKTSGDVSSAIASILDAASDS